MNLAVLPLAITMNAGPQIMSALIFVTAPKPLKLSASFLAGVVIAVTVGLTITYTFASALGSTISLGDPSDSGSIGNIIQYVLVGLLVFLAIKNYVRRESIEPPRWLGALQNAKPRTAFMAGLLLLSVFPSDFVVLVTVGMNLAQNGASLVAGLPFIGATILIAALPVLFYLLFHRRAQRMMPKVRDWMNVNSWVVNIIVYVIFILLILA
jgi:Sap, sulfolipid-1-addressing protein